MTGAGEKIFVRFLFRRVLQLEMNMIEDAELLRCYSETRSEEAFTELVRRHLNLVYSAAIRQVGGDVHLAEDITQSVFGDLARKAASLSQHSLLAGWLYTSTHFAATKTVRGEQRRREREQEVYLMQQTNVNTGAEASWEQLRPVIDDAMHELPEADREAILQRYFEGKPFLQIGAKLGLSENAARMRVERALEKLRTLLAVRGVAAPAAALAAVLGAQAVSAAPAALLSTVVGASLATAAATGGVAAVWSAIASAKLKVAISIACALGAFVALFMQHEKLNQFRTENAALNAMQQSGAASDAETATLARGDAEELERLRGELKLTPRFGSTLGPAVSPFLETLHQDAHASSVEIQNLDPIPTAVTKDKESATLRILSQLLLSCGPQTGEAGAQVARCGGQEHLQVRVEA